VKDRNRWELWIDKSNNKMLLKQFLIRIKDILIYYLKIEIRCKENLFRKRTNIKNNLLHHLVF
jgi:hypothetical protein